MKKHKAPALHFNSAASAKAELRREVLAKLRIENPRILDVYAGPGMMWKLAFSRTENYLGLDRTQYDDGRSMIVGDNTRILRLGGFDLDQFDVFDLDAFGSPAYPLAIICRRLRWSRVDRVGIFLTDGSGFNAKMNSTNSGLLRYLGLSRHKGGCVHHLHRDDMLGMLIRKTAADARAIPESIVRVDKSGGAEMRYIGYILCSTANH